LAERSKVPDCEIRSKVLDSIPSDTSAIFQPGRTAKKMNKAPKVRVMVIRSDFKHSTSIAGEGVDSP